MIHLCVRLPVDRGRCGTLSLLDNRGRKVCGPFPVAGRATDGLAAANGNPSRNPLLRYGDTPTGTYRVQEILASGKATPFDTARFGSHGLVVLEGLSGDAALAEANGRFHVLIVGGKRSRDGALRSTAGSLRLADEHLKTLIASLRKHRDVSCEVEEDPSFKSRQRVFLDTDCQDVDPQPLQARRGPATRSVNREILLSGAAGAMMSVAFVVVPSPLDNQASASTAPQSLQHVRDDVKFLPPASVSGKGYVRMAYGGALQQLNDAQHQTTGKTFDGSNNPLPSDATPSTPVQAPPHTNTSTGNPQIDNAVQQQQQINAIQSEKPPPNATADQLKAWQQNQQQRIDAILHPPAKSGQ